jgi:uncharacterized protein
MNRHLTKLNLKLQNLHCGNCEILVERKFKSIPGVEKVSVSHVTGRAEVLTTRAETKLEEFNRAVQADGYSVSRWAADKTVAPPLTSRGDRPAYAEIAWTFFLVFALYNFLDRYNLIPDGPGIGKNMSYGFIFVIGLAAAFSSCLAVAGGLLLAIAAKYNAANPSLSGIMKLKPTLYFNAGRIVGYTVLGAQSEKSARFSRCRRSVPEWSASSPV